MAATTYYVDPTASGANDGSSQADAWESLQEAIDNFGGMADKGDKILCRHSNTPDETLAANLEVDSANFTGNMTYGYLPVIGVNSSWEEDGSRYIIDGDSNTYDTLNSTSTADYIHWKHFTFRNGVVGPDFSSGSGNNIMTNCISHDQTGAGFNFSGNGLGKAIGCLVYNCDTGFANLPVNFMMLFCVSRDNSSAGVYLYTANSPPVIYGCVIFDNAAKGIHGYRSKLFALNNVIHNNAHDGIGLNISDAYQSGGAILFNRITNNDSGETSTYYGIDIGASDPCVTGYNYIETDGGAGNIKTDNLFTFLNLTASTTTDELNVGDTEFGYTDDDNPEDFDLDASRTTTWRTPIALPVHETD